MPVDDERKSIDTPVEAGPAPVDSREKVIEEAKVEIKSDLDIIVARQKGRALAAALEFSPSELTLVATSISELARNIVQYAKRGDVTLRWIERGGLRGILVRACDRGPGIEDVQRVLQGGYSTSRSLGLGLSGVRRLMDEFEIDSRVGWGTQVTVRKWVKR
ncbi:MAG TPA: anti-sigma regulatory factor [Candidatus Acidoferrales bacterium]|nr:anti-sigma regulatory factor [Candidatus Acidoferrales bacterium]